MPELPEVEIVARRLDAALTGADVESALAPGMNVMKTFEPPLEALAGREPTGVRRVGKMPVVEFGRPVAAGPPDVGGPAARLRQAGLAQGPRLAGADPARGRARAAPARVRHQAARLGEAAGERGGRRGRDGRDAGAGSLAPAAARAVRRADRPAAPPAPAAAPPAGHRRHRPLLGRRDPLGGAPLALQEGLRAVRRRRSSGCTPRCTSSATRSTTTRRRSAPRCPTRCRCRSRSTGARASPARAAGRRSRPSSSPSTRPTTARGSRPAAASSRTAASRNFSSRTGWRQAVSSSIEKSRFGRRVGEGADRDEVDAGLGDLADVVEGDAAGGLERDGRSRRARRAARPRRASARDSCCRAAAGRRRCRARRRPRRGRGTSTSTARSGWAVRAACTALARPPARAMWFSLIRIAS